ncbi:uncharacterized protein [Centruroides vittatus]|uniref:uncharacterized protein n=1 Tax=Centruroides vittatus TaxID=120091 RepID=UPI00351074B1
MDFSLDDNNWEADRKTEILNRKLFNEEQIEIKKKSHKRCRSLESKKSTFECNVPKKLLKQTKNSSFPKENEGTIKILDHYPKPKVKKKKFKSKNNQINKTEECKLVIPIQNEPSRYKYDLDHKTNDKNKKTKSNKNNNVLPVNRKKILKSKAKKKFSKKYLSVTDDLEKNEEETNVDINVKRLKQTSPIKSLPNIEKLKKILTSASKPNITPKSELNEMKKNVTKSGTFILEKEKRNLFSSALKENAMERLKAAKFRYINEKLYTSNSKQALEFFKSDPDAFQLYHDGFNSQVSKWPLNPVDVIIQDIQKRPKSHVIADFGCGNAKIAQVFPDRVVHSFDLFSMNKYVTACNMANVPLDKESVHIAVFCLALMGTNINDYLHEAHRVLKPNGILKVAEVTSRIDNIDKFIDDINQFGFFNIHKDISHKMFIFLDFKKIKREKNRKAPIISLKPCLYKKR